MVAFDIKALVLPSHQFVHTFFIPCVRRVIQAASFRSSSFAKRSPARCSFIFGNSKKSDCARSGLYGGWSKMLEWNYSRSKAYVCRVVRGRALSCSRTIPREIVRLRKDNLRSHWPAENELHIASHSRSVRFSIGTAMVTDISAQTMWQGPTYNCMRHFSTSHWTSETNDRLQRNRCADSMRKRHLLFGWS